MRGYLTIHTQQEFDSWLAQQEKELLEEEAE
jgi:heme/copper-type cytochrome/quinol oxidase subunit 2